MTKPNNSLSLFLLPYISPDSFMTMHFPDYKGIFGQEAKFIHCEFFLLLVLFKQASILCFVTQFSPCPSV